MKKQFYSFLGLLLLLSAWGGAHSAVLAQVQLQKVQTVDVATAEDHYIPAGWTVNYQGTDRTAGQSYSSEKGPRVFTFSQSAVVNKALYMNTDTTDPTYAVYGNQEGYLLSIPAGYVEIQVPAFLWNKDSGKAQVEVLKYDSEKAVSDLEVVASTTQSLTVTTKLDGVTNAYDAPLTSTDIISLHFMNAAESNFVIKVTTTAQYNAFAITGFIVLYDPLAVLVEDFSDVTDDYTPAAGSGWTIYNGNAASAKGANPGSASRIKTLSGCETLKHAFFCREYGSITTYMTYGESGDGEPTLSLAAGKYTVAYDAANWGTSTATLSFQVLKNDGTTAVVSRSDALTARCSSASSVFTPDHIQFTIGIEEAGTYQLKIYATSLSIIGNIVIRKDEKTVFDETFNGLSNAVPATGWIVYNDGKARTQGETGISGGARAFAISGYSGITHVAYMGWQGSCYMTYGEANSGKTLTLEKDKTYRITYYAANWDGSNTAARSMKCEITGNSGEGTILTREDVLRGKCNNGKPSSAAFVTSPDFIQATFTPTTTGAYTLKFTSVNTVISNIKITDNTSDRIVYTSSLDPYGYSTIYLGDNVAKPEGVSVYTAALTDDGTALTLTELEGDVIPANAGLILKGEANAALTFSPPTADATVPTVPTTNALTGTLTGMKSPSDADIYILGYTSSTSSAFWKHSTSKISTTVVTTIDETNNKATITTTTVTTTGSSDPVTAETTKTEDYTPATEASDASHTAGTSGPKPSEYVRVIPAHKAYLSVPISTKKTGAPSIRLLFASDEEEAEAGSVTAIERIEPASAPVAPAIYDLSGRRLTEMTKPGLYIVNGHKKVVR